MTARPKRPRAGKVTIVLSRIEAEALIAAVVDCAMEGFTGRDLSINAEETWGEHWRTRRKAAMAASNRIHRRLADCRKVKP